MITINATFLNGHLIDSNTHKKLYFVHGATYVIVTEPSAIRDENDFLNIDIPRDCKEQLDWLNKLHHDTDISLFIPCGTELIFRIGNSKRQNWENTKKYFFLCVLQEDLYLYLLGGKSGENPLDWRLCECKVTLKRCISGDIHIPRPISADSLNKLYTATSQFLFTNQNCGTANVFDVFRVYHHFFDSRNSFFEEHENSLKNLRKKFVEQRSNR